MLQTLAAFVLVACQDDPAKELFRNFEAKAVEAKSVRVSFQGTVAGTTQAEYSGSIRIKPGKKYVFELKMTEKKEKTDITLTSDGKRRLTVMNGERSEDQPKEGTDELMTRAFSRIGHVVLFLAMAGEGGSEKAPAPDDFMKPSKFSLGGEEKVGDRTARLLTYTVAIRGIGDVQVKLWLVEKDLLPAKREVKLTSGGEETVFTETYSDGSFDEIADKEFEIGK